MANPADMLGRAVNGFFSLVAKNDNAVQMEILTLFCPRVPELSPPGAPPPPGGFSAGASERSPSAVATLLATCKMFSDYVTNQLGLEHPPHPLVPMRLLAVLALNAFSFEGGIALFREASLFSHACGGNLSYQCQRMNDAELRAQPPPGPPLPPCRIKSVRPIPDGIFVEHYPPDEAVPPPATGRDHVGVFTATRDIEAGELLTFRRVVEWDPLNSRRATPYVGSEAA